MTLTTTQAKPGPLRRANLLATFMTFMALGGLGAGCSPSDSPADGKGPRAEPMATRQIIGGPGGGPGEFTIPRALAGDGRSLWVVDKTDRIQQFDSATGRCLRWWHMPESQKGKPTGLTVAPAPPGIASPGELVLYVAHTHAHKIVLYAIDRPGETPASRGAPSPAGDEAPSLFAVSMPASEPRKLAEFGAFGRGPGEFIYPTDVAVLTGADGITVERLYVPEYGDHDRVSVFDGGFRFLFSFGTYGASSAPDNVQFDRPQAIEVDRGRGIVAVADARNHRLGVFTLDGALLRWIGDPETTGQGPAQLRYPWALNLLDDGSAIVAEFGNNRLQRFDLSTGAALGLWGRAGRGRGEFAEPWAVLVNGDRTFVVDSKNHRVQVVQTPFPASPLLLGVGAGVGAGAGPGAGGGSRP